MGGIQVLNSLDTELPSLATTIARRMLSQLFINSNDSITYGSLRAGLELKTLFRQHAQATHPAGLFEGGFPKQYIS